MTYRFKFVALLLVVALAAGCSTTSGRDENSGKFPPWLIKAAEPVAPAIGFVVSRVEWRDGYLSRDAAALRFVGKHLRPFDIILFSNKHRLSGHTGGGLFGHSAVYLGSERDLRALGLWNDPVVIPHRADIRAGWTIIEAEQRHGVSLSPLGHVVETDRLMIVRPQISGNRERRAAGRRFFARIGARFDHHFRLEETERLFCTELIGQSMPGLRLPRRTQYDRQIIFPDDIAKAAIGGCPRLRFVTYLAGNPAGWRVASAPEALADISSAGRSTHRSSEPLPLPFDR
jgi:hypothetical protein